MKGESKQTTASAEVEFKLADLWRLKGKTERAVDGYQRAIRLSPGYLPAYLELTNLLLQLDRVDEAVDLYRQAIAQKPNEMSLRRGLENLLLRRQRSRAASPSTQHPVVSDNGYDGHHGRILLYTDCPGIDGVAQWNHMLMHELSMLGYQVTSAQSHADHHLIAEQRAAGIGHVWLEEDDLYDLNRVPRALTDSSEAESVFAAAKPDLIIFSSGCPLSDLSAKEAAVHARIPFLVVVHCVTPDWVEQFSPYLGRLRNIHGKAQGVVTVSRENLELMYRHFHLPREKGQVIYNGRPQAFFEPPARLTGRRFRRELQIPPQAVVSLTVARLGQVKGHQYQLQAMAQLKERPVWPDLCFIWVGSGSYEGRLRAVATELGVADKIRFLGERSDITDLLDMADMFVLTSQFEGMPMSVMEAMAKGVAVMATAVSGVPEELGETGRLLPSPNANPQATVQELVSAIEAWAVDPTLRHRIGQDCRARAETLFRAERMLAEYVDLVRCHLVHDE